MSRGNVKNSHEEDVGRRIEQIRLDKKLTQSQFAEKIYCDRSLITKLEAGKVKLSPHIRLAICNIFGVRKDWLLTGEEPMYDDRWSLLEQRAKELGEDIHIELSMLKAYKEVEKERQKKAEEPKDAWLKNIFEKVGRIYKDGTVEERASVRGIVEEVYDHVIAREDSLKYVAEKEADYKVSKKRGS